MISRLWRRIRQFPIQRPVAWRSTIDFGYQTPEKSRFMSEYQAATEPIRRRLNQSRCKLANQDQYSSVQWTKCIFWRSNGFDKVEATICQDPACKQAPFRLIVGRKFVEQGSSPEFYLYKLPEDSQYRFYRVPMIPRNWQELRKWQRQSMTQWLGLNRPECDIPSDKFAFAASIRFNMYCGAYVYAPLGGGYDWLLQWLSSPSYELKSVRPVPGDDSLLEVHLTKRDANGETHRLIDLDKSNHWAIVRHRTIFESMPDLNNTIRVEYGPKIDDVAMPVSVMFESQNDEFRKIDYWEISDWSFETTPTCQFLLSHYGFRLPRWYYSAISGIIQDNWLVSCIRLTRKPIR